MRVNAWPGAASTFGTDSVFRFTDFVSNVYTEEFLNMGGRIPAMFTDNRGSNRVDFRTNIGSEPNYVIKYDFINLGEWNNYKISQRKYAVSIHFILNFNNFHSITLEWSVLL